VKFTQEVICISGGSQGIGYAIAERFGASGAKISICARRLEPLQVAEKKLRDQGVNVLAIQADVSQEGDVDRWFSETEKQFGNPGILVNNAGISGTAELLDIKEEAWDKTMAVNCRGVFLCTKRALPAMMKAKHGRIFMLSSIASKFYRPRHSLYFATKWALNGFAHSLAKEVREHNIHVHLMCPGMTETNFFDNMGGRPHPEDHVYAKPEIYAEMAEYICSLPDYMDTLEFAVMPNWQIEHFGIRR